MGKKEKEPRPYRGVIDEIREQQRSEERRVGKECG